MTLKRFTQGMQNKIESLISTSKRISVIHDILHLNVFMINKKTWLSRSIKLQ